MKPFHLDMCLFKTDFLLKKQYLSTMLEVLRAKLPGWCRRLHVSNGEGETDQYIPADNAEQFARALNAAIDEKGGLFRTLVRKPSDPPRGGVVELHGADDSIVIIMNVNERPVRRIGPAWRFGSSLTLQVRVSTPEETATTEWTRGMLRALAAGLDPQYAYACTSAEYETNNMSRDGGGWRALGRDISKCLPGLYWLNFFGPEYCQLMGKDLLLNAPASQVEAVGKGVLVQIGADAMEWNVPASRRERAEFMSAVGSQYFFLRKAKERTTVAPDFGCI